VTGWSFFTAEAGFHRRDAENSEILTGLTGLAGLKNFQFRDSAIQELRDSGIKERFQMNLFRTLEEHIFTLAFGAFHNYAVIAFAVNADPCSAGIASPAEQQPSEPGQSATMDIRNLRGLHLFTLGGKSRKGNCILFTGQTLFAPLLKSLCFVLWPQTGEK